MRNHSPGRTGICREMFYSLTDLISRCLQRDGSLYKSFLFTDALFQLNIINDRLCCSLDPQFRAGQDRVHSFPHPTISYLYSNYNNWSASYLVFLDHILCFCIREIIDTGDPSDTRLKISMDKYTYNIRIGLQCIVCTASDKDAWSSSAIFLIASNCARNTLWLIGISV